MCVIFSKSGKPGGVGAISDQPRLNAGPVSHGSARIAMSSTSSTNEAWLTQRITGVAMTSSVVATPEPLRSGTFSAMIHKGTSSEATPTEKPAARRWGGWPQLSPELGAPALLGGAQRSGTDVSSDHGESSCELACFRRLNWGAPTLLGGAQRSGAPFQRDAAERG